MTQETNHSDYISGFLTLLADDKVSLIDFDELKDRLTDIAAALDGATSQAEQLQLLTEDYTQRIAGMLKAIAVVHRSRNESQQALEFIEQLPSLEPQDLVEAYRKVSARFRDAFPTSFGYRPGRPASMRVKRAEDFK